MVEKRSRAGGMRISTRATWIYRGWEEENGGRSPNDGMSGSVWVTWIEDGRMEETETEHGGSYGLKDIIPPRTVALTGHKILMGH